MELDIAILVVGCSLLMALNGFYVNIWKPDLDGSLRGEGERRIDLKENRLLALTSSLRRILVMVFMHGLIIALLLIATVRVTYHNSSLNWAGFAVGLLAVVVAVLYGITHWSTMRRVIKRRKYVRKKRSNY